MNIFERAQIPINLDLYGGDQIKLPVQVPFLGGVNPPIEEQHILRMCIRSPEVSCVAYLVPQELEWITGILQTADNFQRQEFRPHPWVYVTVRNGITRTHGDMHWHVDGFSMRKKHLPEQDYIWSSQDPTQCLQQVIKIPHDFDPLRHDIHKYFAAQAQERLAWSMNVERLYVIDPYVIHRRPPTSQNKWRTFVRITFLEVPIEDGRCTQNPLMPENTYPINTFRQQLVEYPG